MNRICKFALNISKDCQTISVYGYKGEENFKQQFLHAGAQDQCLCIWYLADTTAPCYDIEIHTYGTGYDLSDQVTKDYYIGTVVLDECCGLVVHIFKKNDAEEELL